MELGSAFIFDSRFVLCRLDVFCSRLQIDCDMEFKHVYFNRNRNKCRIPFSIVGMFFPNIFPDEFKSHHGTIHLYFEAATVIITLVLLGQLLEAKAHGQTNGAIKELLKLAPTEATLVENGNDRIISIHNIKKEIYFVLNQEKNSSWRKNNNRRKQYWRIDDYWWTYSGR